MAIIECIPNVSEGRRSEVVAQCARAIRDAGVHLLDVTADPDHHRSVYTFAGAPTDVRAAVLALFDVAVGAIDLRRHRGVHPRIGAVDVVPLVPLEGATMDDCAALARELGAEIAARHRLPVFLYEHAAVRPERRRLERVRRGGFEALATRLTTPEGAPDFGPPEPHPTAGASAIGARHPLVAWNVNLATDRLEVARAIAVAIRESSGGLPGVKALGLPLAARGLVQVSMNVTDMATTPLFRVMEAIRAEAARHDVQILESEIIGLLPVAALTAAAAHYLCLDPSRIDEAVLETRLARARAARPD